MFIRKYTFREIIIIGDKEREMKREIEETSQVGNDSSQIPFQLGQLEMENQFLFL